MTSLKDVLALRIDEGEWSWLRSHLERGGLIVVAKSLDLTDAAVKVAEDDVANIEEWVKSGKISKPSEAQINAWDEEKAKKFSILIISPFVLIQEHQTAAS